MIEDTTYIKENNDLLKFMLNERYFKPWSDPSIRERESYERRNSLLDEANLEIYITSTCNQNCEYCYLQKNKAGLYPQEYDKPELILQNLQSLIDWFIENDYFIPNVELYSGEIWHTKFGLDILEILYQSIDKGFTPDVIMIPSNCSFLRDKVQTGYIERYIRNFDKKGVRLAFSISVDGQPIEDMNRPLRDGSSKQDDFYERMFLFAYQYNFYFHPMVSAHSVHKWIENHKWWVENCKKYDIDPDKCIMMLEVRNDEWTDETIKYYNDFMNYLIDRFLKEIGTIKDFSDFIVTEPNRKIQHITGYVPYLLGESDSFAGCSVCNALTIRLGDMAICPCHRTAYNKYLYGHFVLDENHKIIDITANNFYMAERILFGNNNLLHFGCDTCVFNEVCLKGCYGSQLEATGDPFIPAKSVCKFFKAKFMNLINKYEEIGLWDTLEQISPYAVGYQRAQCLLSFKKRVEKFYGMGKN